MKPGVGLWIDHRKAVVVVITGKGEEIRQIRSNVEKQLRPHGGARSKTPYGPQDAPPDDMRERAFTGHLNNYFDRVVSCIGDAESILIFGPGEAKHELRKRMDGNRPSGHIIGVETVDKMSDRQIASAVRRRFQAPGRDPLLNRVGPLHRGRTSRLHWGVERMDGLICGVAS